MQYILNSTEKNGKKKKNARAHAPICTNAIALRWKKSIACIGTHLRFRFLSSSELCIRMRQKHLVPLMPFDQIIRTYIAAFCTQYCERRFYWLVELISIERIQFFVSIGRAIISSAWRHCKLMQLKLNIITNWCVVRYCAIALFGSLHCLHRHDHFGRTNSQRIHSILIRDWKCVLWQLICIEHH